MDAPATPIVTARYYPILRRLECGDRTVRLHKLEADFLLAAASAGPHGITWDRLTECVWGANVTHLNKVDASRRQLLRNLRIALLDTDIKIETIAGSGVVCLADITVVEPTP